MASTTCIDCGIVILRGNRCRPHQRQKEINRSSNRVAYRDPVYMAFVKSNVCRYCGSTEDLTKDHIIPLDKGGTNQQSNLQTLCRSCNSAKRNRLMQ